MTEKSQATRTTGANLQEQEEAVASAPEDSLKPASSGLPALVPFGKYLLDREIASGGMARVYLARLRGLGGFEKKLVVKQVRPELASDPRFLSLFVQEANTLVQMSHPHIVPVYELGVVEGVYFLAMEYVEGATLAELLRFQKPFPPALAFYIAECVAAALSYAHRQFGLVHRDVTPNNIMVDRVGHVRLLDFGIAAPVDGAEEKGDVFGSIGYMAPEQARGDSVSPASDLFALGTVIFEALTGSNPWRRGDRQSSLDLLLSQGGTPLPIGPGPTWIPEHIRRLVESLIHRDVVQRPQSAAEVATALHSWLSAEHPEGVNQALVDLVDEVIQARADERGPSSSEPIEHGATSEDGQTKSLATSTALTSMLRDRGKRVDGGAEAMTAPVTGRFPKATSAPTKRLGLTVLSIALAAASVLLALTAWLPDWIGGPSKQTAPRGLESTGQQGRSDAPPAERNIEPTPATLDHPAGARCTGRREGPTRARHAQNQRRPMGPSDGRPALSRRNLSHPTFGSERQPHGHVALPALRNQCANSRGH